MRLIIALIIFLFSANCAIAEDKIELSPKIQARYKCKLQSDIDINKKFSQGYIAPIFLRHKGYIIAYGNGVLYYDGYWKNKKLDLSGDHRTITRMSIKNDYYGTGILFTIDNTLYVIDHKEMDDGIENQVKWKKELKSPIKGSPAVLNNKLAVLTIDNYLYMLNAQNGDLIWSYHNGTNEVIGLHSVSPVVKDDMIIVPFSNGELIAFNEDGKKLWSYKLSTNLLDTQLTDVTTTPKVHDDILIATNNSYIYGIDVKSGNLLWSKPIQVKNMNNRYESYLHNELFIVTANNEVIKMEPSNGQIVWSTNLPVNNSSKDTYYAMPVLGINNNLLIVTNKGVMFSLNKKFGTLEEIFSIPEGVYHYIISQPPSDYMGAYFTTEKKGVYGCYDITVR